MSYIMTRNGVRCGTRDSDGVARAISENIGFKTGGSMQGEPRRFVGTGYLPDEYHEDFMRADYVITSYFTPIAYRVDGKWIVPPVKYSRTTTTHQSTVNRALARL